MRSASLPPSPLFNCLSTRLSSPLPSLLLILADSPRGFSHPAVCGRSAGGSFLLRLERLTWRRRRLRGGALAQGGQKAGWEAWTPLRGHDTAEEEEEEERHGRKMGSRCEEDIKEEQREPMRGEEEEEEEMWRSRKVL